MLPLLLPCALALAPLVPAADVADKGLQFWWRPGELYAGLPDQPGRPAVRPLEDPAPLSLPADLSGWTRLGAACPGVGRVSFELGEIEATAEVVGTPDSPMVQVRAGPRLLAQHPLGRPAEICEVRVAQADALPGLEVLIAWRPPEASDTLRGLRVFHLPEALR